MEVTLHSPVKIKGYNEDGIATWLLEYSLQAYPNLSSDGKGRFGIKIVRNNSDGRHNKTTETNAITDDSDEAMAMIRYFSKKAVTPYVLNDMVEMWHSEKALRGSNASYPWSISSLHT